MVKLVYTLVLGTSAVRREGSSPFSRTPYMNAKVAELVDALDSKSSEWITRVGSIPIFGTIRGLLM